MKQILTTALILICVTIAVGQKPATEQAPKPEVQRLDPQSQPELAEAQRQAAEYATAADVAKARAETAQQKVWTVLYKVMAELKLSPSEWKLKTDQGGLYLERIKPAETAATNKAP